MPLVPVSQRTGYTLQEVAEHNSAKSLWVIINRKVYDVTAFCKRHPGGPAVLLQMGGKDATAASAAAHKSALPANLMWEFCIGSLVRFKVKAEPEVEVKPAAAPPPARPKASAKSAAPAAGAAGAAAGKPRTLSSFFRKAPAGRQRQAAAAGAAASGAAGAAGAAGARAGAPDAAGGAADEPAPSEADGFSAEQGSSKGDLDDDLAQAMGGQHSLATAASLLLEHMLVTPELKTPAAAAPAPAAEERLMSFLQAAFGGTGWPPAVVIKRPFVETHGPLVAAALAEALRRPLPLGEDPLLTAIGRLGEDDERVARFFEAVRDLLFFSSRRGQKSPRTRADDQRSPSPSARRSRAKVPQGVWKNSEGLLCVVHDQRCTFVSRGVHAIKAQGDSVVLNGWRVVEASGPRIVWEKSGQSTEWRRVDAVQDVAPLVGVWRNSEGLMCVVAGNGKCTFVAKGPVALSMRDGLVDLNGWQATGITERTVSWRKASKTMEWQRIEAVQDIGAMEGAWKTSDGLRCEVHGETVSFVQPAGSHTIAMQEGLPCLNGWRAVSIRPTAVSWTKGAKSLEWTRVE